MGPLRTVLEATGAALRDPDDTTQVFRIAEALAFGTPDRLLARLRATPNGPLLIGRRADLLARLTDRDGLAELGDGTLAAAYLEFTAAEDITAQGLVEASLASVTGPIVESDLTFLRRRMRDSHDLWHAVTGYRGDLLGETALLAFTFAQTRHPGIGFLTGLGMLLSSAAHREFIATGYARGRRARWLVAVDWEAQLARPLDEVRRELKIQAQAPYDEQREPALPPIVRRWVER